MGGSYLFALYWLFFPAIILFFFVYFGSYLKNKRLVPNNKFDDIIPSSSPLLGHLVAVIRNRKQMVQWMAEVVNFNKASSTFFLRLPLRRPLIVTANPSNVQHILKTRFDIYQKHRKFGVALYDLFGDNLFLADGQVWRKRRQVASHEFNARSFHKFVQLVTEDELFNRLLPFLSSCGSNNKIVDLQDILRRFTFDIVFRMGLGHDLAYLSSPLPPTNFADSFESATEISMNRLLYPPLFWKVKKFFNTGSEKKLRIEISEMRAFLRETIIKKKQHGSVDDDFISGLMNHAQIFDDDILIDTSINFILGGLETVLAALTWLFWSISKHPNVEDIIFKEVMEKKDIRDMIYTHASIFESLRFYPPLPLGVRESTEDDMLPDGTKVKKGTTVIYHTYAMGRSPELWGSDWMEFRPDRWLKIDHENLMTFVARDSFTYPVFHGGPRICLGKEIAFLQIKTVVAGVLRRFHIVPAMEEDHEPAFLSQSSSKMTIGFLVKVVDRNM